MPPLCGGILQTALYFALVNFKSVNVTSSYVREMVNELLSGEPEEKATSVPL